MELVLGLLPELEPVLAASVERVGAEAGLLYSS